MITDKTLIIIALFGFITSLTVLLFLDNSVDEDLQIINITSSNFNGERSYISFNANIQGNALYDEKILSNGTYAAVLTKIGEDFYYITGLQQYNGTNK